MNLLDLTMSPKCMISYAPNHHNAAGSKTRQPRLTPKQLPQQPNNYTNQDQPLQFTTIVMAHQNHSNTQLIYSSHLPEHQNSSKFIMPTENWQGQHSKHNQIKISNSRSITVPMIHQDNIKLAKNPLKAAHRITNIIQFDLNFKEIMKDNILFTRNQFMLEFNCPKSWGRQSEWNYRWPKKEMESEGMQGNGMERVRGFWLEWEKWKCGDLVEFQWIWF